MNEWIDAIESFHPEVRTFGTIVIFMVIMVGSGILSFRYAQHQFLRTLKKGVDEEVHRITTHLEQKLDITLTKRDDDGNR